MEGHMLMVYIAAWRIIQEARTQGHQGDQGIRNQINGTQTSTPKQRTREWAGVSHMDKGRLTQIFLHRAHPTFVLILNWTRRSGRLVSRAFRTDSVSESHESVTTRRARRKSCTATFRRSMSKMQRDFRQLLLRMHEWWDLNKGMEQRHGTSGVAAFCMVAEWKGLLLPHNISGFDPDVILWRDFDWVLFCKNIPRCCWFIVLITGFQSNSTSQRAE